VLGWDLLKILLSMTTLYFLSYTCFRANVTRESKLTVWKTTSVQFRGAGYKWKNTRRRKGRKRGRMERNITEKKVKTKDNNKNENGKEQDNNG
jgi:hypothetical protein